MVPHILNSVNQHRLMNVPKLLNSKVERCVTHHCQWDFGVLVAVNKKIKKPRRLIVNGAFIL
jgi:hypothetical protein